MVSETSKNLGGRPCLNYNVTTKIRMPEHIYNGLCLASSETKESINQLMVNALEEKYCEYETELKKRIKMNLFLDNLP